MVMFLASYQGTSRCDGRLEFLGPCRPTLIRSHSFD